MIYDGFMFHNELELLEVRLNELWDVVDKFILVEATETHSGRIAKRLVFEENKGLFKDFSSKIVHVVVSDMPKSAAPGKDLPRTREEHQRDAVMSGLGWASDADILISGDADEIPSASAVKRAKETGGFLSFHMRSYNVFVNAITGDWVHSKIGPVGMFRASRPSWLRHAGSELVENGGWHFSSLGGPERICLKMTSNATQTPEVQKYNDLAKLTENIRAGVGQWDDKMTYEELGEAFPAHLVRNQDRFKHLIWRP